MAGRGGGRGGAGVAAESPLWPTTVPRIARTRRRRPSLFLQTSDYNRDLSALQNIPALIELAGDMLRFAGVSFSLAPLIEAYPFDTYFTSKKYPGYMRAYLHGTLTNEGLKLVELTGDYNAVPSDIFDLSIRRQKGELDQLQVLEVLIPICKDKAQSEKLKNIARIEAAQDSVESILAIADNLPKDNTSRDEAIALNSAIERVRNLIAPAKTIESSKEADHTEIDSARAELIRILRESIDKNFNRKINSIASTELKIISALKARNNSAIGALANRATSTAEQLERDINSAHALRRESVLEANKLKATLNDAISRAKENLQQDDENLKLTINLMQSAGEIQKAALDSEIARLREVVTRASDSIDSANLYIALNEEDKGYKNALAALGLNDIECAALLAKPVVEFLSGIHEGLFGLLMNISDFRKANAVVNNARKGEKKGLTRSYYTEAVINNTVEIVKKSIAQLELVSEETTPESLNFLVQAALQRAKLFLTIEACSGEISSLAFASADYKKSYSSDIPEIRDGLITYYINIVQISLR